ncbi:MAG: YdeI/OmpD-associated family protein [Paracoccaceae bacterium]
MIEDPDSYFADGCGRCARYASDDCAARVYAQPLAALRGLCLGAGLAETAKWGHPTYIAGGRNVAILGALRAGARVSFPQAGLLTDPDHVLRPAGPNTPVANVVALPDMAAFDRLRHAVARLLAQARDHAIAGRRAPRTAPDETMPEELTAALDADPALAEAFAALTPGRRRSHVIHLRGAKQARTRAARVERLRPRILAGKGAMER